MGNFFTTNLWPKLALLLFIYLVLGVYLLPFFQYQIDGDGTALLSITYALKNAHFYQAINAYWGILSSLLQLPFFLIADFQPIYVIKISQLFIGLLGLTAFFFLGHKFPLKSGIKTIIFLGSIPIFLFFSFVNNDSDLLIVTMLLTYLNLIFSKNFWENYKLSLIVGLIGGLLVLVKEYFFYFFILHFSLLFLLECLKQKKNFWKKLLVKSYLPAIIILILISLVWGFILMGKYNHFMLGSRGVVNLGIFNPWMKDYPMFTQGLIPSPNPDGVSAWDEPTLLSWTSWNPLNKDYFFFELGLFKKNIQTLVIIYQSYSVFYIPLILISLAYLLSVKKSLLENTLFLYSFLTILLMPLGYLTLSIEGRYIWLNYLLGLLLGGYLISKLSERFLKYRGIYLTLTIIFVMIFAKSSVDFLRHNRNQDHTFYDQAKFLKENFNLANTSVAANKNWHQTLYVSVFNRNQFYGLVSQTGEYEKVVQELKKYNIDYYFLWENEPYLTSFQKNFKELKQSEIQNLHLFYLK